MMEGSEPKKKIPSVDVTYDKAHDTFKVSTENGTLTARMHQEGAELLYDIRFRPQGEKDWYQVRKPELVGTVLNEMTVLKNNRHNGVERSVEFAKRTGQMPFAAYIKVLESYAKRKELKPVEEK